MSGAPELRPERAEDADALRALHLAAFAPSTLEAAILDALRAAGDLVHELSLVALRDGVAAGHVAISRAAVDETPVLALGPIAVLPELQRAGIGAALVRATLAAAGQTDFPLVALLGHAEYYPRFGFEPAGALGIRCPYDVQPRYWMACKLPAYDPAVRGAFRYAGAFSLAG